jgi:hypothetical protein
MNPRARTDDLVVQDLADETLVYDQARHRAHCLNRAAALVWRHCDGRHTVADLARVVARELGLPEDEDVVWLALDRLKRAHLLEGEVARPGETGRLTRRDVLRRLGLAGGLALLLPAVTSILAPDVAQAVSGTTQSACQNNPAANAGRCCVNVSPRRKCVNIFGFGICIGATC